MKVLRIFALLVFVGSMVGQTNPYTVACPYHHTNFVKTSRGYPGGVCTDFYAHRYYDSSSKSYKNHTMMMPCPKG